MSEYSESYHLRASSRQDAVSLLERAGLQGFVFPSLDGWVTFVAEGEAFVPNAELVRANEGVLLHFVFGEDHGWEFRVFKGKKQLCEYSCSWEEDLVIEGVVTHAQLESHLGLQVPALKGEAGLGVFCPQSVEQVFEVKPAYAFAAGIGLTNYRWLSFDYMESDVARGLELPLGVLVVE